LRNELEKIKDDFKNNKDDCDVNKDDLDNQNENKSKDNEVTTYDEDDTILSYKNLQYIKISEYKEMESKCINLIKHNNSLQNCYNEMKGQLETLLENYDIINKSKDRFKEYDNIIKLLKKENDELRDKLDSLSDSKSNDKKEEQSDKNDEYVKDLENKCQELLNQNQELQGC